MISLESEIMSNSYDPPGLLDGLGSGCRADAGPATSPSYIEGRGTASKDWGVKPSPRPTPRALPIAIHTALHASSM